MNDKYTLTKEGLSMWDGTKVFRIQALKDFGEVSAGEFGGFIETEVNLSYVEGDTSWIYDNSEVYGSSKVINDSVVKKSKNIHDCAINHSTIIGVNGLSNVTLKHTYMYN